MNFDKPDRKYSLVATDDLVAFRRSKVKVRAGRRVGAGIHVDVGSSKSIFRLIVHIRPKRNRIVSNRVPLATASVFWTSVCPAEHQELRPQRGRLSLSTVVIYYAGRVHGGKRDATVWRPSVRLSVQSAYSP